ncbi:serine/arginine repetitive matrix protein 1-like [Tympanuchus pallidicinctus]|uniref:serine/arginine repetitive matrix protein 1-like n=1 Tax=Tympanuchus pallidicinctus TaxID=109042 RepID=UPI002286DB6B|nr:serine/arginine repetitive matrix protein 1-like [Tympanuchus pallidicinctus]
MPSSAWHRSSPGRGSGLGARPAAPTASHAPTEQRRRWRRGCSTQRDHCEGEPAPTRARPRWEGPAPRPPRSARPGPARPRSAACREETPAPRPPAPRLARPPSPPLHGRSSAPSSSRWRRRRRLSRPGSPLFPAASPRSSAGGSAPRRRRRQCCKEPLGVPGGRDQPPLETFATCEELQTSQADISGAQKFYIKFCRSASSRRYKLMSLHWNFAVCHSKPEQELDTVLFQIAQRKQGDSHIFQREERRQWSRLIQTCVWWPCSTKAAFKREAQRYLMSCEMRRCC